MVQSMTDQREATFHLIDTSQNLYTNSVSLNQVTKYEYKNE